MRAREATLAAVAVLAMSAGARAQDAAAVTDASAAVAPGPVDPHAQLPPGHPAVGTGDPQESAPHGGDPHAGGLQRAQLPSPAVEERDEVPAGTVLVAVVDGRGEPVPEAPVRLGLMRGGEPGPAVERRAGPDGVARFEGLETGQDVSYRASTERDGARFGALPFQLTTRRGVRVTLVRHETTPDPRGTLLWDARVEIMFRDERITVIERMRIVNLSAMSLGGSRPEPRAYLPPDGLRFRLPRGHTAFQTAPMMADVRLAAEGDAAVLRGAIAPTTDAPIDVVFQYQLKLDGGDFAFETSLPLPIVSATVATEAPTGLTLSVDGFPAAQTREHEGDRVIYTQLERRPSDPAVETLRVRLGGIPRAAGPARTAAAAGAGAIVLGALFLAISRRGRGGARRTLAELDAERERILAEAEELARLKAAGEVGPRSYAQRRRELSLWLAALLKERDEAAKA